MLANLGATILEKVLEMIGSALWGLIMEMVNKKEIKDTVNEANENEDRNQASSDINDMLNS